METLLPILAISDNSRLLLFIAAALVAAGISWMIWKQWIVTLSIAVLCILIYLLI